MFSEQDNLPLGRSAVSLRDGAGVVFLVFLTAVAYLPLWRNGFVNWDDPTYITQNQLLRLPVSEVLKGSFTGFPLGNYHPLTTLFQALEFTLFGLNPLGYHLISLLTHLVNLMFVYVLLRSFRASILAATVATAFFALHPLRVEAVAWVSAQKDLWSTSFVLLSLYTYLSFIRDAGSRRGRFYALALISFLCALLCKGTALVLPLLLFLVDLGCGRRMNWTAGVEKFPFILLSILFGTLAVMARSSFQGVLDETPEVVSSLWLAAYRLVTYGLHSLIPLPYLFPCYPPSVETAGSGRMFYLFGVLLILCGCLYGWRRWRTEVLGIVFFITALIPALPLQNLGYAADRFTYLPAIGLSLAVMALLDRFQVRVFPSIAALFIFVLLAWLGVASMRLSRVWHDSDRLISEYIELYRANSGRELYLALALETRGEGRRQAGDEILAQADFAAARQVRPVWVEELISGGEWLLSQGRLDAAANNFSRAARLDPDNAKPFAGRSIVYRRMGRLQEALIDADQAVRLSPNDAVVYNTRGNILLAMNRMDDALKDFSRAIAIAPDADVPYLNRAQIYIALGQRELAVLDLQAALRVNPQNVGAQESLTRLRDTR